MPTNKYYGYKEAFLKALFLDFRHRRRFSGNSERGRLSVTGAAVPSWGSCEMQIAYDPAIGPPDKIDYCGEKSPDGSNCWCDDSCVNYGDCCSDYQQVCTGSYSPPAPKPTSQPSLTCSSHDECAYKAAQLGLGGYWTCIGGVCKQTSAPPPTYPSGLAPIMCKELKKIRQEINNLVEEGCSGAEY